MNKQQLKERAKESAKNSDWMKYIESAQSIAHTHGLEDFKGQNIYDWLDEVIEDTIQNYWIIMD